MIYILPDGRQLKHVVDSTWQLLTIDGKNVTYLTNIEVVYK